MRQTEWEIKMASKVLELSKVELLVDMPHLSIAIHQLIPVHDDKVMTLATQGQNLYYNPIKIMSLFESNPRFLTRALLHTLLHCLYCHIWIQEDRDDFLWDVACDICIEKVIDALDKPSILKISSLVRKNTYEQLENVVPSAQNVYQWLLKQSDPMALAKEFVCDGHQYWPKNERAKTLSMPMMQQWQNIAKQTTLEKKPDSDEGSEALFSQLRAHQKKQIYRNFLMRFASLHEENKIDLDEFDLASYTYGLSLYKNLALIEEVETSEVKRVADFVIVLDISYSTKEKLVKRFLEESINILSQANSFYSQSKIHILQCDDKVQKHDILHSQSDIDSFLESFSLMEGNKTDFRPAFLYVKEKMEAREIHNIAGLIYFTDGKGTYPKKKPDYKCAFVFMDEYDRDRVPSWAIQVELDERSFEREYIPGKTGN